MSHKIIIIGGVAGGMSAATRARRLNETAHITVLEKGGYISFANCGLPYYLSGKIQTENKLLVTTPDKVRERFAIDVRIRHEVLRIDRRAKAVEVRDLDTGQTMLLPYDKLILATGATPILPAVDHLHAANVFLLRSMEDTQVVHRFLKDRAPQSVAIIGGGFIGLEVAEAMRQRGLEVSLIEKSPHALPPLDDEMARPLEAELRKNGVNLITGVGLKNLRAAGELVDEIELEDGRILPAGMVLLSIGVRPNVALASAAGLTLGASGAIAVDDFQRTSDPDVYAVGDASEALHGVTGLPMRMPLAGPANRQGRLAGEHAATGAAPPRGKVMGTAIVQVFGLTIAITGLGELAAKKAGFDADSAFVHPNDHAGYYPGASPMTIKLIYDRPTGRVLGAQIAGGAGVDKRADVIATLLHFKGTVDDLATLDLAYAPQFASAKDPVHMAAMVAQNQRRAVMPAIPAAEIDGRALIDVRTPAEYAAGALAGAINIPLDDLRARAGELDRAKPTAVYCQAGLRGYIAQRILAGRGFADVVNVKGGYLLARG